MILCPLLSSGQTLGCSLPKSQLSSSRLLALGSPSPYLGTVLFAGRVGPVLPTLMSPLETSRSEAGGPGGPPQRTSSVQASGTCEWGFPWKRGLCRCSYGRELEPILDPQGGPLTGVLTGGRRYESPVQLHTGQS